MNDIIKKRFQESIDIKKNVMNDDNILKTISLLADEIIDCIGRGGKIVLCGNGGSASDALHFAGEMVGRFKLERRPVPAIVLNSDVATLTAIANDYGYENVFSRQVKAHILDKDVFIGISTSGNSENILRALTAAKDIGAKTAALLGKNGGKIGRMADYPIIIESNVVARIQEIHILIIHIICEIVEREIANE